MRGDCMSFHASACSLPPLPINRTSRAMSCNIPHRVLWCICKKEEFGKRARQESFSIHPLQLHLKARIKIRSVQKNNGLIMQSVFFEFKDLCYLIESPETARHDNDRIGEFE